MGLFAEDEFESAKSAFTTGKGLTTDAKKFNMWIRKCDVELEESGAAPATTSKPATAPASTTTAAASVPSAASVVVPSSPATANATAAATASASAAPTAATPAATTTEGDRPAPRFRHEWFQTDTHVNVDVFAKGIKKPALDVAFGEQNLCVTIKLDTGSEFVLDFELADKIVIAESSFELLSTKIEIKMKKSKVARWKTLENTGEGATQVWDSQLDASQPNPASLYPSSRGAKNWDAIAKSDEEDKLSGDHALNNLFRTIYKDASEEQRRAMMKSYVESNGTVLSTNWEEVGAGEVKGQAPAGMEMHSWTEGRDERSAFAAKKK